MIYVSIPILEQLELIQNGSDFQLITDLGGYVGAIAGLLLIIATIATFLYLVWGGLRWILAGSDKGKLDEAKQQITNAVMGLTVAAVSWAIFLLLNYFFGIGVVETSSGSPLGPQPYPTCNPSGSNAPCLN